MTISKFADRVRATGSDDSDFGVRLQPLKTPIQAARNPGNEQLMRQFLAASRRYHIVVEDDKFLDITLIDKALASANVSTLDKIQYKTMAASLGLIH
jgi:hypothetical protein